MPDVPAEAVRLAVAARAHALIDRPDPMVLSDETLTRMMLEAAAPVLAEAVAQAILAHMEAHGPGASALPGARQAWRRHFRIAAQVAGFAFSSADDIKRAAIEAIARGDIAVCHDHGQGRNCAVTVRNRAIYLCGGNLRSGPRDACPNVLHDFPLPSGYVDASEAAERRMQRGWGNKRCAQCGLYGWEPGRPTGDPCDERVPAAEDITKGEA